MAEYTNRGKAIIQQCVTQGCTAAVTAMLRIDHGKPINTDDMMHRTL